MPKEFRVRLLKAVHLLQERLPSGKPDEVARDFVGAYIRLGRDFLQEVKRQKALFRMHSIERVNAVLGSIHRSVVEEATNGDMPEDDARQILRFINEHRVILGPKAEINGYLDGLTCWHIQRDAALLQVATEIQLRLGSLTSMKRGLEQPHRKQFSPTTQIRLTQSRIKNLLENGKVVFREVLRRNPKSGSMGDRSCLWNEVLSLADKWGAIQTIEDRYAFFDQQLFIDNARDLDLVVSRPQSYPFEGVLDHAEYRATAFDLSAMQAGQSDSDLSMAEVGAEILTCLSTESGLDYEPLLQRLAPHIEEFVQAFQAGLRQAVEGSHLAVLDGTGEYDTIVLPLIRAWSSLHRLALLRNLALDELAGIRASNYPLVVPLANLLKYIEDFEDVESGRANSILQLLMFQPGKHAIASYDPFLTPLVALNGRRVLVMEAYILNSRFARNVLKVLVNKGLVDLDQCGPPLERHFQEVLEGAGFRTNKGHRTELFDSDGDRVTDLDVVACRDGLLFLGQAKAVIPPGSPYEIYRMLQRLVVACHQLKSSVENSEGNREAIKSAIDWPASEAFVVRHVLACILTNDITLTGHKIGEYMVLDPFILDEWLTEMGSSGADAHGLVSELDSFSRWHDQYEQRVVYHELNLGSTVFLKPIVVLDPVVG